ncbi:TPA: hypothetical protein ACXNC8_001179 [Stenotrophomonas maltophilia]
MDKVTRRAAAKAADLLLAAAGYNPKGVKLKAAQQKRRAYAEAWGQQHSKKKRKKKR